MAVFLGALGLIRTKKTYIACVNMTFFKNRSSSTFSYSPGQKCHRTSQGKTVQMWELGV